MLALNAPIKHCTLRLGNQSDESPKSASYVPFRGIGPENYFAHLPITGAGDVEGDLPTEFAGRAATAHTVFPLLPKDSPVRKHVRTALLWEPAGGLVPNLGELSNGKQRSGASLFMFFSVKTLATSTESESLLALNGTGSNMPFPSIVGFPS